MVTPYVPELPAATAPPVVLWARVYSGLLALVYLGVAVLGVVVLAMGVSIGPSSGDAFSATLLGALYIVIGLAFTVPTAWAAVAGRKKYAWYLNLVLICIGFTSCACLPFCIPLIIYWLKPEVKSWYGI